MGDVIKISIFLWTASFTASLKEIIPFAETSLSELPKSNLEDVKTSFILIKFSALLHLMSVFFLE